MNTDYQWKTPDSIPHGFVKVCNQNGWNTNDMWTKLNGRRNWLTASNHAYMYFNGADGHWWMDEPNGLGVFVAASQDPHKPPVSGWKPLKPEYCPLPTVEIVSNRQSS
jgi:hypothetical protein